MQDPAVPVGRGRAATVAGGVLSLAGASAAGWIAATHLPNLMDVVLQSEAAPDARTVDLVALGTVTADEQPTEQLVSVDPAAVVASATGAGKARQASSPRPAAAKPAEPTQAPQTTAAAKPTPAAEPTSTPRPSTPAPESTPPSTQAERPSNDQQADSDDADRDEDRDSGSTRNPDSDDEQRSDDRNDRGTDSRNNDDRTDDQDDDRGDSGNGTSSDRGTGTDARSGTSGAAAVGPSSGTVLDPRIAPGAPNTGGVAGSPSQVIDTKNWYLTLPTGKQGSPDLVEGSALARYHSQFFQLNQAKDGVVFTAGTGGVTTSGSHYPRSELREMFGSEKASWDGRKGRHTMEIVQAITETPKEKPDVIAGQIHGTSDDLMQIHLSGNLLRVKYADGQKYVDLDQNYRLGTMFAVKIESAGGKVKVWYNGQLKADLAINSTTSYFKAGVYTNSNPSTGDKAGEGQVVIRSLNVRHE